MATINKQMGNSVDAVLPVTDKDIFIDLINYVPCHSHGKRVNIAGASSVNEMRLICLAKGNVPVRFCRSMAHR
ncbi:hypothetical protein M5J15_09265 [Serratia symbiotica]|uniref:hypothetical protein n=1 Tax=Serratia symbiotica TaxID=138074 RepID=UPI002090C5DF|nr:hypothetical protein [Serratia symbiotica]USS96868.1 hypothetical protein M5J15_09265 [Serratia symbiotica]